MGGKLRVNPLTPRKHKFFNCAAHQMFTGEVPFDGYQVFDIKNAVTDGERPMVPKSDQVPQEIKVRSISWTLQVLPNSSCGLSCSGNDGPVLGPGSAGAP